MGEGLKRARAAAKATRIPKELSPGEEAFWQHCVVCGLTPEREYVFAAPRKLAFDFAWPHNKVAVEIDGGTAFGKSRHSRGQGFVNDCQKFNEAAKREWLVFRFTTEMVLRGEAIDLMVEVLRSNV
jgi:very-short-patch-repair endonuclease